jgi:photosystem II stability/assembly factor-like uncharacterized protein
MRRFWVAACVALACLGGVAAPRAGAYVPAGGQGWYWQMPQPAGDLTDVTFASASDVWAVGLGGTIIHSGDAGATWTGQQSGTPADLFSVSFGDDQHGWTCGSTATGASIVLATSDGGTTWVDRTPGGLTRTLTNLSFVDASHGWAGTTGGFVMRTSDGGATWTSSRVGTSKGALTLDFVDATHGWAIEPGSGSLWHTANGGASWALVHAFRGSDLYVGGVDFVDSSHGWAYAVRGGGDTVSTIMVTSDAGKTWRTVRSLSDQWVVCLHARSASGLAFVSAADSQDSLFDPIGEAMALGQTSDGGRHWTEQRVGSPLFTAALAGNGDALCAVGEGILTSSDGGVTWGAASSGQLYEFTAAAAVSATDLWAVEYGGALLHSSDGSTWTEQPGVIRWSQELKGVSFPDADDGWVVGATQPLAQVGVILHTSDGGATWAPQASTLSGELSGVDFVDDTHGWAITDEPSDFESGAGASLERTSDAGQTWIAQFLRDTPVLTAVSFVNDDTGWVAGEDDSTGGGAVIFKTIDGGQTWTREDLPSGMDTISGLQFLDQNVGWAVGSQDARGVAWLLHTTDGGVTWTRLGRLPFFGAPTPIRFLDDQHGWIGGQGVWATSDGGATWSEVSGMTDVSGLAATDATHVWAFGADIVSTVDGGEGDLAPPQTLDDADWSWHRKPVTITLKAHDTGGSGLAETQYRTDGDTTWQSGASISVPAPADHSYDGQHTYLYRSSDNAGNVEATEICGVGIDTLGPTCSAPKQPTAGFKRPAIVRFMASDQTSGVAVAVVRIVTRSGHVMKTLVSRASTHWGGTTPYYWLRFNCSFRPGIYRVTVSALDFAGNRQVVIGRSYLHIVRSGAPAAKALAWPAGLPAASMPIGAPDSFAARLAQAAPWRHDPTAR